MGVELAKIHKRQNHTKLARDTFVSNAVGLLMGMLSAQFVSQFFDVRSADNLWGLFSKQTIVSGDTYRALCFGVEFFVALLAFTLTDHVLNEYRSRREKRDVAGSESISQARANLQFDEPGVVAEEVIAGIDLHAKHAPRT